MWPAQNLFVYFPQPFKSTTLIDFTVIILYIISNYSDSILIITISDNIEKQQILKVDMQKNNEWKKQPNNSIMSVSSLKLRNMFNQGQTLHPALKNTYIISLYQYYCKTHQTTLNQVTETGEVIKSHIIKDAQNVDIKMLDDNRALILGYYNFGGACPKFSITQWKLDNNQILTIPIHRTFSNCAFYTFKQGNLFCIVLISKQYNSCQQLCQKQYTLLYYQYPIKSMKDRPVYEQVINQSGVQLKYNTRIVQANNKSMIAILDTSVKYVRNASYFQFKTFSLQDKFSVNKIPRQGMSNVVIQDICEIDQNLYYLNIQSNIENRCFFYEKTQTSFQRQHLEIQIKQNHRVQFSGKFRPINYWQMNEESSKPTSLLPRYYIQKDAMQIIKVEASKNIPFQSGIKFCIPAYDRNIEIQYVKNANDQTLDIIKRQLCEWALGHEMVYVFLLTQMISQQQYECDPDLARQVVMMLLNQQQQQQQNEQDDRMQQQN